MLFSRFLFRACFTYKGLSYKVGRRLLASETHSCQSSADSEEPLMSSADGNEVDPKKFSLILRVLQDDKGNLELTPFGQQLDTKANGRLVRHMKQLTTDFKVGEAFVVADVDIYEAVALSCCGPKDAGINNVDALDEKKENVRCAFAGGYKKLISMVPALQLQYETDIEEDVASVAQEGHRLAEWKFTNEFKPIDVVNKWKGYHFANAQNWARYLSQMPTNKMTAKGVVQEASNQLQKLGITVKSFEKKDIEAKKMSAFLAVAQGSSAPPVLLECDYVGKKGAPSVLIVAKGLTFDSGGLCLKKPEDMLKHAGMTGAAVALGTMMGVASLKVPINVKLLVPLCENMISGQCLKVGDVVQTLKGLKVKVEDTDLEGHLMLADALTYGQAEYKPTYVMSVASLTPGIAMATGGICYGCFTKNENLWKIARDAGIQSGDRPWRFPIWDFYRKKITGDTPVFDLKNRGTGLASHCIGAAFLDKFVSVDWLHYDITGVGRMAADEAPTYLDPNLMTGRPTRALIHSIIDMSKYFDASFVDMSNRLDTSDHGQEEM